MLINLTNDQDRLLSLITESPLVLGKMKPSADFIAATQVAIKLNGKVLLTLGIEGDTKAFERAHRLVANINFRSRVFEIYQEHCHFDELENKLEVDVCKVDKDFDTEKEYHTLCLKKQGEIINKEIEAKPSNPVEIYAVFTNLSASAETLAVMCSVDNIIMLDFIPEATPLSEQVPLV